MLWFCVIILFFGLSGTLVFFYEDIVCSLQTRLKMVKRLMRNSTNVSAICHFRGAFEVSFCFLEEPYIQINQKKKKTVAEMSDY